MFQTKEFLYPLGKVVGRHGQNLGLGKSGRLGCLRGCTRWAEKPVINGVITPYKQGEITPATPFIRPFNGIITPSIAGRSPSWSVRSKFPTTISCTIPQWVPVEPMWMRASFCYRQVPGVLFLPRCLSQYHLPWDLPIRCFYLTFGWCQNVIEKCRVPVWDFLNKLNDLCMYI